MKRRTNRPYPIGSISHGTMRPEDLIPCFLDELRYQIKNGPRQSRQTRKEHFAILNSVVTSEGYWETEQPMYDLESLFDALECYAAPYFYFGVHPGDGSDYGYWLSEFFQEDFSGLTVSDTGEIPSGYRGEVLHINDHGNMTLYVKSARKLTEVWGVV